MKWVHLSSIVAYLQQTLNSLNWCRVSRATSVKGKKRRSYPPFLIHLCQTGLKPHADWRAQRKDQSTQMSTHMCKHPGCASGWPELLAAFPETVGPLEGCLQPSFHLRLNRQTTAITFLTSCKLQSASNSNWKCCKEYIRGLPSQMRRNVGVPQGPSELIRNLVE